MTPVGTDGFRLPLRMAAPREGWTVKVTADGLSTMPTLLMPDGHEAHWPGGGQQGGQMVEASGKDALNGAIVVGPVATADTIVSRHRTGERHVQLTGMLPPAAPPKAGGTLRIYWDRSRSRLNDHRDAEYALLRRTIATMRAPRIEVVTFASDGATRTVTSTADAAIEAVRSVGYRGATSFAAVAETAGPAEAGAELPTDRCLLFSDGRSTIDRA